MLQVRKSLTNLVFFYVFFPLVLLLAWINYQHYIKLTGDQDRALETVLRSVSAEVESGINGTGYPLGSLADTPQSFGLLLQKSDTLRQRRTAPNAAAFAGPGTESELRQSLLALLKDNPAYRNVALVDVDGTAVAKEGREFDHSYAGAEWFRQIFLDADPEPYFIGMHSNDTFTVATAVMDRSQAKPTPVGALVSEVSLGELMSRMDVGRIPTNYAACVIVPYKWHRLAEKNIGASNVEGTVGYMVNKNASQGYWNGISYRMAALSPALGMAKPPQVMALHRGSAITGGSIGRLTAGVVLSLAALLLITGLASASVAKINRESAEIIDAGTWMLHQTRGGGDAVGFAHLAKSPVYDEILRWQAGYKQSIADDIETYAFENKRDLFLARDFQMAYMARPFPPIPAMPLPGRLRLKFSHRYKPALAIGGDFFEVLNLSPETGGVFIADVMGHGTRSALITSILRVILSDSKPQGGNARNFLREMNRKFTDILNTIQMEIPLFASGYYFVADCTARVATYSTAGHPAPFHLRRQTNTLEQLKVSEPHGAALGISADEDYTGGSCRMMGGDVFLFYTDGAYECFNPRGEEFGLVNLEKTIRRHMHRGADEILQSILDTLEDYSGGTILHDDICLLAVEIEEDLPTLNTGTRGTASGTHKG